MARIIARCSTTVVALLFFSTFAFAGSITDGIGASEDEAYEILGKTAATLWDLQAGFFKAEQTLSGLWLSQDKELLVTIQRLLDSYASLAKGYNEIHALYDFRFSDVARIPKHQKYGVVPRVFNPHPSTRFSKPQA